MSRRAGVVVGICAALLVGTASAASAAPGDADLAATLAVPATASSTAPFTVTLTVHNTGPAAARNIGTGVRVAGGLRIITATGGAVTPDGRNVGYLASSLPAGETRTFTLTLQATATAGPGPFRIDGATASTTGDPVPANNTARGDVTLTLAAPSAQVAPDPDTIASAPAGTPVARSYTVRNTGREFTGSLRGAPLDSALTTRTTLADEARTQFPVAVPAGATALSASVGAASDTAADLDVYLFDCTTGSCVLADRAVGDGAEESVRAANPAPGNWIVLVDGRSVPAGVTGFDYRDLIESPAFGAVQVTDADTLRPAGSSWTVPGTVTALTAPAAGRRLVADLPVVESAGTTVTTSRVVVQAVD